MATPTRLPSLHVVVDGARRTLRRFPFVLGSAAVATLAGILAVDQIGPVALRGRLLAAASLGIPLFTAIALYAERRFPDRLRRTVLAAVGIALLVGFHLAWPNWSADVRTGRYIQLSAAFHLLVAFLPFVGHRELNGFWQYNRALVERFALAVLYSVVLYAGLALALAALDNLFGVAVPGEGYGRLWIVAAFLFNTWFFLAGVPSDLAALERSRDYDARLKGFTQYALIPLVVIYLAILIVYLAKVLVTWNWPSGWIGYLVSSVAAVGLLTLLIVHPIADEPANRWVRTYTRGFHIALLPAIFTLWLAIWQRIDQYGMTERRYFLLVLSVWLAGIAVFYIVTHSRDIRIIPGSLCLVALVTFAGPWGAYGVSRSSQVRRLEGLLVKHGLVTEGRARPATGAVPFEDRREMSAGLRYLIQTHGAGSVAPWFGDSLAQVDAAVRRRGPSRAADDRARMLMGHLGLEYIDRRQRGAERRFTYRSDWESQAVPVTGFDFLVPLRSARPGAAIDTGLVVLSVLRREAVQVRWRGEVLMEVDIAGVVEEVRAFRRANPDESIPREMMRVSADAARVRAVLYLSQLRGTESETGLELTSIGGRALIELK